MTPSYNHDDKLMHKAHHEGFRARSVYKLEELDKQFHLVKPDYKVLDLGAAPGSWLQYVCNRIAPNGKSLGLDLKEIARISNNTSTQVVDITYLQDVGEAISQKGFSSFNLVLSDLAPNISGVVHSDHIKSVELDRAAFEVAKKFLDHNGSLVMKIFPGSQLDHFVKELKESFTTVKLTRVKASRDSSNEMYLICLKKK
jgi:23S rRNA (uridine2552-2'-O)-methyltransferase